MSNVLSQNEIDALLNSLASAESENETLMSEEREGDVKNYDFRTANKFSKDQIRTLYTIFDNFATVLATRLTGILRTLSEVTVVSVEEQLFGEFNNSIPLPALIAVVDTLPLSGSMIFDMSASVAYAIISRLFGGVADYFDINKPFSEIDLTIMENVLPQCLDIFDSSWEKVAMLDSRLVRIETSPQFTQVTAVNEPAAIATFNVKIDEVEDMMAICIPHFMIQPVTKRLNSMVWTLGRDNQQMKKTDPQVREQVLDTNVKLNARFEKNSVSMRELLTMKPGDVIRLDHRINQFIMLDVEKIPKFKAVLGVSGGKRVVQIAEIIKEKDDIE